MNKKIFTPIENELIEFQRQFSENLKSKVALLDLILKYVLKQKGKKIRPALVLLTAKLAGTINQRTYIAANLVELLHTATLIHDDVVDEAKTRRGLASINAVWKNKAAVLIGDYLLSRGLLLSLDNDECKFLKTTSLAVKLMSEGELMQIQKARNFDASEETYFEIIKCKTASLIKTCCSLGVQSVSTNEKKLSDLSQFGENLGIAFQLRDDYLDYAGRKKLLGKSTGNDLKEKKFTMPLIHSLKNSPKKRASEIMNLIKSNNTKKFDEVFYFVNEYGGLDYTVEMTKSYCDKAKLFIENYPSSPAKESLMLLLDFVSEREY
uniref:Polyprenyl diphosphate synthase n=1 Tax=wastewater metagenome TaxID=527639 RepID=A0A0A8KXJ4_9ZZZZ